MGLHLHARRMMMPEDEPAVRPGGLDHRIRQGIRIPSAELESGLELIDFGVRPRALTITRPRETGVVTISRSESANSSHIQQLH